MVKITFDEKELMQLQQIAQTLADEGLEAAKVEMQKHKEIFEKPEFKELTDKKLANCTVCKVCIICPFVGGALLATTLGVISTVNLAKVE